MRLINEFLKRIHFLLRGRKFDQELRDEIALHLTLRAEKENVTSADSAQKARTRFGNVTRIQEESRATWAWPLLDSLVRDVRFAGRTLLGSLLFTAVVVLTLALGIGANAAIYHLLYSVVIETLPVPHPEQLSFVTKLRNQIADEPIFSYPAFEEMRRNMPPGINVAAFTAILRAQVRVGHDEDEQTSVQLVSNNFFKVLRVAPRIGHDFLSTRSIDTEPATAILNHAYWARRFGSDPNVIGRVLFVNGTPVSVIGVAPDGFFGVSPGEGPDVWIPLSLQHSVRYQQSFSNLNGDADKSFLPQRQIEWLQLVVRTAPQISSVAAETAINQVFLSDLRQRALQIADSQVRVHYLQVRLKLDNGSKGLDKLRSSFAKPLWVLMGAVALVLSIACANVIGLSLARTVSRQREIAVRSALGASRAIILRQLTIESLALALLGGVASILVEQLSEHLLLSWTSGPSGPIRLDLQLNTSLLLFIALLSLFLGIILGLLPAWSATSINPIDSLKSASHTLSRSRLPFGRASLTVQIAFSFVLLTGAGLFVRTLLNYMHVPLGFQPANVISVSIDPLGAHYNASQLPQLYRQILQRVKSLPGVQSAAFSECGLLRNCRHIAGIQIAGQPSAPGQDRSIQQNTVNSDYFRTLGIPLLSGRLFAEQDAREAAHLVLINQSMARRYFKDENPVGHQFGYGWPPYDHQFEIIGVVGDARVNNIHEPAPPMAYHLLNGQPDYASDLEIRTASHVEALQGAIREALHSAAPHLPVTEIRLLRDNVDDNLLQERLLARLGGVFAALALLLVCLGVYGVLSYQTTRRTGEIGIRIALGAEAAGIRWMIIREALLPLALGLIAGTITALCAVRLVHSLLFAVSPFDPISFSSGIAALLLSATLAACIPAWRASRVNPIAALRHE